MDFLEELKLLVPWVDHEEAGLPAPDVPCTDRCPACRLQRIIGAAEKQAHECAGRGVPGLFAPCAECYPDAKED